MADVGASAECSMHSQPARPPLPLSSQSEEIAYFCSGWFGVIFPATNARDLHGAQGERQNEGTGCNRHRTRPLIPKAGINPHQSNSLRAALSILKYCSGARHCPLLRVKGPSTTKKRIQKGPYRKLLRDNIFQLLVSKSSKA